jgi:hypothetical protein
MFFTKMANSQRDMIVASDFKDGVYRKDVSVTTPAGRIQPNQGSQVSTDILTNVHKGLKTSQTEFDWVKNTSPFQRLRNLLMLEENWDGYGAPKFSRPQVDKAFELYSSIYSYYLSKGINFSQFSPFIAPCSDGAILFEWAGKRFQTRELEIFVPSAQNRQLEYLKCAEALDEEGNFSIEEVAALLDWLFSTEH